ncbi:MAG: excinuclease ABC subunit UvrC [Clostridia bacterium]|nr:excinuclease ABC subunit UvrC [Clostridia bacterium]
MCNPHLQELLNKALSLPLSPGVYLMYNKQDIVIYVGKAKNLKNRVCQYFRSGSDHTPKVAKMVSMVARFEYIVCQNEFEALVLEASLIKQYQPKYNILLKDDKGYHYIRVSPAPWRRISAVKQLADDGATYLGPYYSASVVGQSVDQAVKVFGLPTCHKRFPADFGKGRPCLNRSIGLCSGVCTGKVSLKDHEEAVEEALNFLKGGVQVTLSSLNRQMEEAAEALQFEKAARLRDRIRAIQKLNDKQKIVATEGKDQDVIGFADTLEKGCFEVFHIRNGNLTDREHFFVDSVDDDPRTAFLMQYYQGERQIPPRVLLDQMPENPEELTAYLTEQRGKKVTLLVPQRGEQRALVQMCLQNAEERLVNTAGRKSREQSVLEELAALLSLSFAPKRIESYDISHTAGDENVAGMVVFANGRPAKKEYRRFKINGFAGQDDYGSMREVLTRRLNEYEQLKHTGEGFGVLPDLILLDGGKGQLGAVLPVLRERGYAIPVFGMVKDSRHHTRAIVGERGEIEIKANRGVFTFITSVQDEVHRFAIAYHRKRAGKKMIRSSLLAIEGIGPRRAEALLKAMGSVEAISKATEERLLTIKGMNRQAAKAVFAYFHPKNS